MSGDSGNDKEDKSLTGPEIDEKLGLTLDTGTTERQIN